MQKISTPAIDAIIGPMQAQRPSICSAWGQTVVTLDEDPALKRLDNSLVYFAESKKWGELSWPVRRLSGVGGNASQTTFLYGLDLSDGTVYKLSTSSPVFQDNGVTFTATVQTARITHGTQNRKICHSVSLICDKQTSGTVSLYYCDADDGNYVLRDTFDLTSPRPIIYRCGSYYGRSYKLEHTTNGPCRLLALEEKYEVCA